MYINNTYIQNDLITSNKELKLFLSTLKFKKYANIDMNKIDDFISLLNKKYDKYEEIDKRLIVVMAYLKRTSINFNNISLTDDEKIYIIIKMFDPDCLTYKLYKNANVPNIKKYSDEVYKNQKGILRKAALDEYYKAKKEKEIIIDNLRKKLIDKVGIFIPCIVEFERCYLLLQKKKHINKISLRNHDLKDILLRLEYFITNIDSIEEINDEDKKLLDNELNSLLSTSDELSIKNIIDFIFFNKEIFKSTSHQFYFFINSLEYMNCNDTLSHIVEFNGTWDNMNEDLNNNYGFKSKSLLELRLLYNRLYK